MPMKIAFVCSPYRADTHWQVKQNIQRAEQAAAWLWSRGIAALCPQMNTAFFSGITDERVFLDGIQEMMLRCDMVVSTVPLGVSMGCDEEMILARKKDIPIYMFDDIKDEWPKTT